MVVPIKTVDQQVRLSWHRVREWYKAEALATSNRLRGLLVEFGGTLAQSDGALRRTLADLEALSLPSSLVELLRVATSGLVVTPKRDVCETSSRS